MMEIRNTEKVVRMFDVVVNDLYCSWNIFLENVESCGWTAEMLQKEIERCDNRGDFVRLANRFV